MSFIPEIEQQSPEIQADFQLQELKKLLSYLQQRSPFYQQHLKLPTVDLQQIRSLADLAQLPVTEKKQLEENNWDFLCVPRSDIREYTTTSGTLGKPVTIALTQSDLDRLAYNEFLSFHCMEITEQDTVQLMLTLDRQFMAGIAYYSGLQKIGTATVRTGPGQANMQWESIQRLQTTTLVAVPSFLLKMAASLPAAYDLNNSPVRKALAIGENLRDEHLQPNALAQLIKAKWNIHLYSTYAATEMQTAFTECREGHGGHHHPELLIVELLDEENQPVPQGVPGEVTITTLGVTGMPLLRYKTGDLCKGHYETCPCGRRTMRLGPVLGRKRQMIKYKGTTLYPAALINLLQGIPDIEEYCIRIEKDEWGKDRLTFLIQQEENRERLQNKLQEACRQQLRVVPEFRFMCSSEMQALQFPPGSRKQRRIVDLR